MSDVDERRDQDMARNMWTEIRSHLPITCESINVVVRSGWLTLEGRVEWQYQRQAAEEAARRVGGVKGVINLIELKIPTRVEEIDKRIEEAFKLNAEAEASRKIESTVGEISPKGRLRSWIERATPEHGQAATP